MRRLQDIEEGVATLDRESCEQFVRGNWPHVVALAESWVRDPPKTSSQEELRSLSVQYEEASLLDAKPISKGCERAALHDAEAQDNASHLSWLTHITHGWEAWGDTPTPDEETWARNYHARRRPFTLVNRASLHERIEVCPFTGRKEKISEASSVWRYGDECPTVAHAICMLMMHPQRGCSLVQSTWKNNDATLLSELATIAYAMEERMPLENV